MERVFEKRWNQAPAFNEVAPAPEKETRRPPAPRGLQILLNSPGP